MSAAVKLLLPILDWGAEQLSSTVMSEQGRGSNLIFPLCGAAPCMTCLSTQRQITWQHSA
jgi:hypothetical protein